MQQDGQIGNSAKIMTPVVRALLCVIRFLIEALFSKEAKATSLELYVKPRGTATITLKGGSMVTLRDDLVLDLNIAPKDAKGLPAAVESVKFTSSDESIAKVTKNPDGMSAVVEPVGLGTAQITAVADAEFGFGVTEIMGTLDIQVVAGQAVTMTIAAGPPRPPAPPAEPV